MMSCSSKEIDAEKNARKEAKKVEAGDIPDHTIYVLTRNNTVPPCTKSSPLSITIHPQP
jgi:hypothetical protein